MSDAHTGFVTATDVALLAGISRCRVAPTSPIGDMTARALVAHAA